MAKNRTAGKRPQSVDETIRQARLEQHFKDWLNAGRRHIWMILLAVAGVVVVFGLIWGWQEHQSAYIEEAYAAFGRAQTVQEYTAVAERYADTEVAVKASFAAARRLFEEDDYDGALEGFTAFLAAHPRSALASSAMLGRAYALEAAGRPDEAQPVFVELAERFLASPLRIAEAWIGAARCAEAQGLVSQARTFYENALAQDTDSIFGEQARQALVMLEGTAG